MESENVLMISEGIEENIRKGFNCLIAHCHENSVDKKWWNPGPTFPEALMLVVSELSEALEYFREGHQPEMILTPSENGGVKPVGIPVELADAMIRIFDICGAFNIPLDDAILAKMKYNRTRSERHGGKKL